MFKRMVVVFSLLILMISLSPVAATPSISFSVTGNIDNLVFIPERVIENSTGIQIASIETSGITNLWTVTVCDYSDGKDPRYPGHLVEWDGSQYVTTPQVLGTNLSVMGYGGTDMTNATAILGPTPKTIEQGTTNSIWTNIPVSVRQYTDFNDLRLTSGHSYRTLVTFEGTAS